MKRIFLTILSILVLTACESDNSPDTMTDDEISEGMDDNGEDEQDDDDPDQEDDDIINEDFFNLLVGDTSKTWKIKSATVEGSNGNSDITLRANVQDDEFLFKAEGNLNSGEFRGQLIWKERKVYDWANNGASDAYHRPRTLDFDINEDGILMTSEIQLELNENMEVQGFILLQNSETISISLKEKQMEDYKSIPTALDFEFVEDFNNILSSTKSTGFRASYQNNNLYLSYRDDANGRVRKVFKYDPVGKTLDSTQISFQGSEFVSSRLHFFDNKLVVMGSAFISELDLSLDQELNTISTGLAQNLSRAGTAAVDNAIYVLGGDTGIFNEPYPNHIIRIYENDPLGLKDEFTLNTPRRLAEGEIVDDIIYIFGGENVETAGSTDGIFIYDNLVTYNLVDKIVDVIPLSVEMNYTSAVRYENLIFVAGRSAVTNMDTQIVFGALNTETKNFNEIPFSLENLTSDEFNIEAMTVLENTLYVALAKKTNSTITIQAVNLENL